MLVVELVLDVTQGDRGLADASLAEQDHLEIVAGADHRAGHNPGHNLQSTASPVQGRRARGRGWWGREEGEGVNSRE